LSWLHNTKSDLGSRHQVGTAFRGYLVWDRARVWDFGGGVWECLYNPATLLVVLFGGSHMSGQERPISQPPIEPLTRRERDILALLAQGHTGPEIAQELTLAVSSVKWHTQHLHSKLGVNSKKQAVARARELGLLGGQPGPVTAATASVPGVDRVTGASVPSGTVTFLFTDIEGSTSLWQQHPQA